MSIHLGPVVQKRINTSPRLKVKQGVYLSTPMLLFNADIWQNVTLEEVHFEKHK